MRLLILFILLISIFSSCQGQPGNTGNIGKNTIVIHGDSILPNYSYKGYDISPFVDENYIMSFNVGDEYLVKYQKKQRDRKVLEKHTIIDTISLQANSMGVTGTFTVPIFDDSSAVHPYYIDEMLFFKGFETYNTNFLSNPVTNEDSGMEEKGKAGKLYQSWKRGGTEHYYTDAVSEKRDFNEITYSVNGKKQILIQRYAKHSTLNEFQIHSAIDYDGDNIDDLVIVTSSSIINGKEEIIEEDEDEDGNITEYSKWMQPNQINFTSYLLFLSSEAEEGEVVKHVSTRTIITNQYISDSEDDYLYKIKR